MCPGALEADGVEKETKLRDECHGDNKKESLGQGALPWVNDICLFP